MIRSGGTVGRHVPALHPVAWWVWAGALAIAVSRITNPVLLVAGLAVVGFVVAVRRPASPWDNAFGVFLRLGLIVIAVRIVLFAAVAATPGTHVLVDLPAVHLPGWLAGLRLGGPVTAEGLLAASYDGLRLAAVLCCIGAANALTSPRRLLKSLPAALFEAGVAVTVALSVAPQAVATLRRLRVARRLRGRPSRGWRAVRGLLVPTLEGALDGSVELAAAMDARGFGRRGRLPAATRRVAGAATTGGLLILAASSYGLLVAGAPRLVGWPLAALGVVALAAGLGLAARGGRTRHRPDPWRWRETVVAASGVMAAVLLAAAPAGVLTPATYPPVRPGLALAPCLGLLVALLPARLAPAPETAAPVRAAATPPAARPVRSPEAPAPADDSVRAAVTT